MIREGRPVIEPTKPRVDADRALQFWKEYQQQHDVSDRIGQAVGIDPIGRRVWFGESARDVMLRLRAEGLDVPLLFLRVGYDYYWRKVGRRWSPAR
jgi:hypothetical protein